MHANFSSSEDSIYGYITVVIIVPGFAKSVGSNPNKTTNKTSLATFSK